MQKELRPVCSFEGCLNPARSKGYYTSGRKRYGKVCNFHHARPGDNWFSRKLIPNDKCEKCGWDKAFCDRHRIDPKLGYRKENVLVLCPNCHRIETVLSNKTGAPANQNPS